VNTSSSNSTSGVANFALVGGAGLVNLTPGSGAPVQNLAQGEAGGSDFTSLEMTGILTRSNTWQYYPISAAPLGVFSDELMPIAYESPRGWPLSSPDYSRVQAYIAGLSCIEPSPSRCTAPHDIRSQYWNSDGSWSAMATPLQALHYPTHLVTITGNPSGGSFTLTWNGHTTHDLAWNASASQVQWALYKLAPNSSLVNVRAEGGPGSGLPEHYLIDMTAAGKGTLSASGANLQPSGAVSVTVCTSSNPDCAGFTRSEYTNMRAELTTTEWPAVDRAGEMIDDLWSPFGSSSPTNSVDIQGISSAIQQAISSSNNSDTTTKILETFQNILSIASEAAGFFALDRRQPVALPHASPVASGTGSALGIISGALGIASIWTDDSSGNRILNTLQTTTQNLAADSANAVADSQVGLERLREILVSDYGKLTTAADFATAKLPWNAQQQQAAVSNLIISTRQTAYNTLIPAVYPQLLSCSHTAWTQPNPLAFNQVTGYTQTSSGTVEENVNAYLTGAPVTNVFAAPSTGNLAAGETPSAFWDEYYLPGATCPNGPTARPIQPH
jgi:hypothetical protein